MPLDITSGFQKQDGKKVLIFIGKHISGTKSCNAITASCSFLLRNWRDVGGHRKACPASTQFPPSK